jgi:hypothetical protein
MSCFTFDSERFVRTSVSKGHSGSLVHAIPNCIRFTRKYLPAQAEGWWVGFDGVDCVKQCQSARFPSVI